ncbi:MAG: glycosyltransferase family 4 protein [Patescibacteria group bacterium]
MKIAHIICTFPPYKGGIGNVAYEQVKKLVDLGHEVTVFTPAHGGTEKEENNDFEIKRLKSLIKFGNSAFLPQLLFKLKKFDVVQLHYPFFGTAEIAWLAKKFGLIKKLVIFYHMDFLPKNIFFNFFSLPDKLIKKSLLNSADKIIVSSLDYINELSIKKYFKNNKEKFVDIPFGSQFAGVEVKEKPFHKIRAGILFVGVLDRAHRFKGVDVLLKSFKKVLEKNNNIKLNIVGGGNMKEEYIKLAKKLGVINKVNFAGKVSDEELKNYYNNCDFLVLPSTDSGEAFGLVLVEAMSFGKPVIASNLPGVRTVCEDNINGFLVEPRNINDLYNKMLKLIENKDLAEKIGKKSRELVDEKYSWQIHVKKLEEVYKKLWYIL